MFKHLQNFAKTTCSMRVASTKHLFLPEKSIVRLTHTKFLRSSCNHNLKVYLNSKYKFEKKFYSDRSHKCNLINKNILSLSETLGASRIETSSLRHVISTGRLVKIFKGLNSELIENEMQEMRTISKFPKQDLHNIYWKVAQKLNNGNYFLIPPEYRKLLLTNKTQMWECTYRILWPEKIEVKTIANSKKNASTEGAYRILFHLKKNGYTNGVQPVVPTQTIQPPNVHIPRSNVLFNAKEIFSNYLFGGKQLYFPKIDNETIRYYSTMSSTSRLIDSLKLNQKEGVETNLDSIGNKITNEDDVNLRKIFPSPKSILHNIYNIVAQELKNHLLVAQPMYQQKTVSKGVNIWICTYHLRWPQDLKFVYQAKTKMEASDKAALLALRYLKENDKIANGIYPKIESNLNEIKKESVNIIKLKPEVTKSLVKMVEIYENDLMPYLVQKVDDVNINVKNKNVEDLWPERDSSEGLSNYLGLHRYLVNETQKLPISSFKNKIIDTIQNNQIVIIKGEPGCGKSTRVPQYILEGWAIESQKKQNCRIIVTQPRRIAAFSLAERVANERNERIGDTVGYQVRFKSNFNRRSGHILYCTTGILLRRLQSDPNLSDCTHIILDEAHERDVNTDLLLNLMKQAAQKNPDLKLIVMSATIDAEVFKKYFETTAVIEIPGFTYPVAVNFLDENFDLPKSLKMANGGIPAVVHEDVTKMIDYVHKNRDEGAILCFLPGWEDIRKVRNLLNHHNDMSVICLHSRIQDDDQRKVYWKPPAGIRKVILATNIAETSVTIDDVKYVIDTGIQKDQRFDVEKGLVIIDNNWISKSSMNQRKGRAGRVGPGESFHLYPKSKYNQFSNYSIPEILRTSLTKIVLDSKVFSNNMPATEFLGQLLSPPDKSAVITALDELKSLELLDENENLLPLGRVISNFQLEPKLGKAMVNSVIYKCVTPIIDIVTLFSAETELFSGGLHDKESIKKNKRKFSRSSDHLSLMRMFEKWLEYMENEDFDMADDFCNRNGLVSHKLNTIRRLREIHFDYLYKGLHEAFPLSNDLSDNDELVKAVMLSGVGTLLMHRNYDFVKGQLKNANVLITRHNHKATVTPESVNFKRSEYPSNFLMYINETRSDIRRITVVREVSLITPLAVLLFKNNDLSIQELPEEQFSKKINSREQVLLKLAGTKIEFITDKKDALLLQKCKDALREGMRYYIHQLTTGGEFDKDLNLIWDDILLSLNKILESESV